MIESLRKQGGASNIPNHRLQGLRTLYNPGAFSIVSRALKDLKIWKYGLLQGYSKCTSESTM